MPRVKRDNVGSFMGNRRAPQRPDEQGAAIVVDLVFGGRVILYTLDATHYRVRMVYAQEDAA